MKIKPMVVGALVGFIFTNEQVIAKADENPLQYTRYDMEQMLKDTKKQRFQVPVILDNDTIHDVKSAKDDYNNGYKGEQMDVWDSWAVKNPDGTVATVKGYNVVFALVGNPNNDVPNRLMGKIGVFYQNPKDKNKGTKSWHYAGVLFNSNVEGASDPNNDILKHETAEWSGSAMVQPDGNIRLFYTSFSGSAQYGGYDNNKQTLTTAQVSLKKTEDGLVVNHKRATDRKPVFAGDGKYYETIEQSKGMSIDDHCLRDPQIVNYKGKKYLIFESNTGSNYPTSLDNDSYYGGNSKFISRQKELLNNSDLKQGASLSNAAIGVIALNDDYSVKKVMKPLVAFNLVTDETERPSIVSYKGRWYLFTATHGWRIMDSKINPTDSFMLGFSSSNPFSNYKPLNKHGLVAYDYTNVDARDYSYSYSVQQTVKNPFLMTAYMTQIGASYETHATFSPTFQLKINKEKTSFYDDTLSQGQVTY